MKILGRLFKNNRCEKSVVDPKAEKIKIAEEFWKKSCKGGVDHYSVGWNRGFLFILDIFKREGIKECKEFKMCIESKLYEGPESKSYNAAMAKGVGAAVACLT